jgi:NRAMP (natural resistance-associated macrophage protein)-like metal ion transporter
MSWHIISYPHRLWRQLGPGLITGAADDDPSGIATYSQAGAQFGYSLGWTMLFTFPLMAVVQEISARIGRITRFGLAGNLRRFYPAWLLRTLVGLLVLANTLNLGADLGAMGSAVELVLGGSDKIYVLIIGFVSILLQVFMDYQRYVVILKWLTLSLFAYVGVILMIDLPWRELLSGLFIPDIQYNATYWAMVVAVFGTTISPYMFFWQSSQEAENVRMDPAAKPLLIDKDKRESELKRIRYDTLTGMGFSNLIGLFILITAAATLHAHGITDIQTSEQAAEALRPLAGRYTALAFSLGIVGTGLLAVPVLAGSAAYAVGEAMQWPLGLGRRPLEARAFYVTLSIATLIGTALNFTDIDPIRALFWSAILNGIVAVPILIAMMLVASSPKIMGRMRLSWKMQMAGWFSTGVMALCVVIMLGCFWLA